MAAIEIFPGTLTALTGPLNGDNDHVEKPGVPREVPLVDPDPLTAPLPGTEPAQPTEPIEPSRRQPVTTPAPERVAP